MTHRIGLRDVFGGVVVVGNVTLVVVSIPGKCLPGAEVLFGTLGTHRE